VRSAGASKPVRPSSKRAAGRSWRAKPRRLFRYTLLALAGIVFLFYGSAICALIALKWIDPPTTSVQMERRMESWFHKGVYRKQYSFVPLRQISLNLQHAVIAAEDARFYEHHGFDWKQVRIAATEDLEGKRMRGASTIDQQLVKNLFLTTSRSPVRKLIEATLVPPAEIILGKQRILELYLNVVEWASGVYGCEAASQRYFHVPAARVSREQSARLAAVLPAPRRRRPRPSMQIAFCYECGRWAGNQRDKK
jgi:monofunctional biosynthetic peptidoglycan transglycosylase